MEVLFALFVNRLMVPFHHWTTKTLTTVYQNRSHALLQSSQYYQVLCKINDLHVWALWGSCLKGEEDVNKMGWDILVVLWLILAWSEWSTVLLILTHITRPLAWSTGNNVTITLGYHIYNLSTILGDLWLHYTQQLNDYGVLNLFNKSTACLELPSLANGFIQYGVDTTLGFDEGTIATHTCNDGFLLIGNMARECLASGDWSGQPPECRRMLKSHVTIAY